jgi:acetolactate synthase I/II/III large subunit
MRSRDYPTRTGAQLLVDALRIQGVDTIFCVPGESFLSVLDALRGAKDDIRLIVCRHEGAAANMAEAHGKLTGTPGICMVSRGPGATHASIGVHTAKQDSTPMILLIGQVEREFAGRESFQEIDYRLMFLLHWPNGLRRSIAPLGSLSLYLVPFKLLSAADLDRWHLHFLQTC